MNPGKPHDMLFNHMSFSEASKKAIPIDSYWFTILREPLAYFESFYQYYRAEDFLLVNFTTFMSNPSRYMSVLKDVSEKTNKFFVFDLQRVLGLTRPFENHSSTEVINFMEENFQLVIISAYFDEGLIYLKSKLCWDFSDIVYFEQNQRSYKATYSLEEERRLNIILNDVIPVYIDVYNHFEKKFREQILNICIQSDVEELRYFKRKKQDECLLSLDSMEPTDARFIPNNPVPMQSYKLKSNSTECLLMTLPEKELNKCLKNKERGLECDLV